MDLLTLVELHKKSLYNKEALEKTNLCGCFYCCETYKTNEIKEWTDNGNTAICPKCGIDSIIPLSKEDFDTKEVLEKMFKYYFK